MIKSGFKWGPLCIICCLMLISVQVYAQDDCSNLTASALESVSELCGDIGRNQVCYGNLRVDARLRDENAVFNNPADTVPVGTLEEIHTYGLDVENDIWGLALLRIQANLPDTLPGQNVTILLYGDVTLTNAGSSAQPAIIEPCTITTTGNISLHAGPGTDYNVINTATSGQSFAIVGQNPAGDWLQIQRQSGEAWIFKSLTNNVNCDFEAVPVIDAEAANTYGPMQAFYLRTGVGAPVCAELPPDSLVVRSPEGVSVVLNVNGVEIVLASTIALTARPSEHMVIEVLGGRITATAQDTTVTAPAGATVSVPLDENLEPAAPPTVLFVEQESLAPFEDTPVEVFEDDVPIEVPEEVDSLEAAGVFDATWRGNRVVVEGYGDCAGHDRVGNSTPVTSTFSLQEDGSIVLNRSFDIGLNLSDVLTPVGTWTYVGAGGNMTLTFTSPTSFSFVQIVDVEAAECDGTFLQTMDSTAATP